VSGSSQGPVKGPFLFAALGGMPGILCVGLFGHAMTLDIGNIHKNSTANSKHDKQMAKIICSECKSEITTRQDLAVVGRSFVTYHRKCFKTANGIYKFYSGYPINSVAMWMVLVLLNTALWATHILFNTPLKETFYFSLFSLVLFVGARLIAYFGFEIKLPKK
jgi:hypothetical protein